MRICRKHFYLPALLLLLTLAACGGGGGDGGGTGGGGGSNTTTYTGTTAAADLNDSNSKEVSGGATEMGSVSGNSDLTASANGGTQTNRTGTSILSRAATQAILNKLNTDPAIGAITNFDDSIAGSCGGTTSTSLTLDDVAKTFSGSLTYNNFCEGDITLNGSATVAGSVSGNSISFTMNIATLIISEKSTGNVYKAENYVITITDSTLLSSFTVSISGKFYHPKYGYVLVTTLSPLQYNGSGDWPFAGVIKITEDASGDVDSARLTALDTVQYQLDIDIGNDGVFETSTIGNWTDL